MIDAVVAKRGRGRPPGSLNRPKGSPLKPEEVDSLRRRLAVDYAEAIVAESAAADRVRAVKDEMRAKLGKSSVQVIGELILDARETLVPTAAAVEPNDHHASIAS